MWNPEGCEADNLLKGEAPSEEKVDSRKSACPLMSLDIDSDETISNMQVNRIRPYLYGDDFSQISVESFSERVGVGVIRSVRFVEYRG